MNPPHRIDIRAILSDPAQRHALLSLACTFLNKLFPGSSVSEDAMRHTTAVYAWITDSSRGTTRYETLIWPDGQMTCDCPGWIMKRKGQERECKHTKAHRDEARTLLDKKRRGLPIPAMPTISDPPASVMQAMSTGQTGGRIFLED